MEKNLIPGLSSRMWKLNDNNLLVLGWYQTGFFHYYTTRLTLIKMCLTTVMFGTKCYVEHNCLSEEMVKSG
jgi:hypothetical protein